VMHSLADIALDRVDQLILARMLVNTKPASIHKDLGKLATARLSTGEWTHAFDAHWNQLVEAELIECKRAKKSASYSLTEEGRAQALRFLQIDRVPANLTWARIQTDYLVPLAMDIKPGSRAARQITKAPGLKQAIIARSRGLPVRDGMKATDLITAIAWKLLGVDGELRFNVVTVVQRLLWPERHTNLNVAQLQNVLAALAVGARPAATPGDLRSAAVCGWMLSGPDSGDETDLAEFAQRASDAARHSPTGWFGNNKVFISHVWRQFRKNATSGRADFERFKQRLIEANREGLLHLSRADLVEAMDPDDVRESLTEYANATFHFVRT
jgi:hypothetical protein